MFITTWNSQGDPTSDDTKSAILKSLLRFSDMVLIQECGDMSRIRDFKCVYLAIAGQAGAYQDRCTTCILAKEPFCHSKRSLPSCTGRWVITANYKGYCIATLHAYAGANAGEDISGAMRAVHGDWIIGGDMNLTPSELLESKRHGYESGKVCLGSTSRTIVAGRIESSGEVTHPASGKELDYFIVKDGLRVKRVGRYYFRGGDHHPVFIEI